MLFVALVDRAIDKRSEAERRKADEQRQSFTWQKAIESIQRNTATRHALDAWTPREVAAPLPEPLDPASPEAAPVSYLEYWKAGNYGGMGQLTVDFAGYSPRKLAGQARSDAGVMQLIEHTLLRLEESTPVVAMSWTLMRRIDRSDRLATSTSRAICDVKRSSFCWSGATIADDEPAPASPIRGVCPFLAG